jgi:hypothetical protein
MTRRKNEVIFRAKIDYSDARSMSLRDINENSEIEQRVVRALTQDLPRDMEAIFGVNIDVQMKGTRAGSIVMLFGVVIATVSPVFSALSRYKNLYDSVVLIKNQAHSAIAAALNGSGKYSLSVDVVDPSERSLEETNPYRWWRRRSPFQVEFMPDNFGVGDSRMGHRDGSWFLLMLCILEGVALGMLVYSGCSPRRTSVSKA